MVLELPEQKKVLSLRQSYLEMHGFQGVLPKLRGEKHSIFGNKILGLINFFCSDHSKTSFFAFLAKFYLKKQGVSI